MLRLTIELVPFGDESRKKKIAEMVIANTGEGYEDNHCYEAWTAEDAWSGEPAMVGRLEQYDRRSSVWELVRMMLEAIRLETHKVTEHGERLKKRLLC